MLRFLLLFGLFSTSAHASITTLTDGSSVSWDLSTAPEARLSLGGNHSLANPTNGTAGQVYTLILDDGGHTLQFGSHYLTVQGLNPFYPVANGTSEIQFQFDGTYMLELPGTNLLQTVLAPSGLSASTDQTGQINLSWTNNDGNQTAIKVQRYDTTMGQWADITSPLSGSATSYSDSGLDPGSYDYRVIATNSPAASLPSSTATGTAL